MFDPDEFTREVRGGMVAASAMFVVSVIGAALIAGAVLYWWVTTRG